MNKYDDVIKSCSNLIYMIINKYFKGGSVDDLYQVGAIGVMKAYDNYKNEKGAKFSTYAYKYIYGELYAYVNSDRGLKVSKENYILYKKINEGKNILSQRLMREPTINELSNFLEIDAYVISSAYSSMEPIDSLDRIIYKDSKDIFLFDTISDNRDYYDRRVENAQKEVRDLWLFVKKLDRANVIEKYCKKHDKPLPWDAE